MKQFLFLLPIMGALLTFTQCKPSQQKGEGISGQVTWLEGNQMPRISEEGRETEVNPKGIPIQRLVRVYPLTNFKDAKLENGLFQSIASEPIQEVETDQEGRFKISLAPGTYSLFTVEEEGLFANMFDAQGNIQPIIVKKGEWTLLDIVINYKAYY
ncbi:carboxypeptidase regulatory-like domain-containing protein [Algoriphagus sp. CAU 1675]|uniref:carboxypeptidase regulatory-like domain-containing protein n=1 Tax=Algoriphagus sp. CAU 1675 TaxID=3032597 RepID=UPI0023DB8D91|nr:carboxypeptidase regulatory-like domain-containing protein [Algoriphagus sp. CAU 1675]MDF2157201.1 carboxypeptidase regulatory-like domain-containing protein [Algoriphagus sp. CAU 1675]